VPDTPWAAGMELRCRCRIFVELVVAPPESSLLYTGHYDPVLVALSIVAAVLASYASLLVSQHILVSAAGETRRLWVTVGGLCLGVGIWAMHFVGMLAFSLPCSSSYDTAITSLSTIPGILAGILAIRVISRRVMSRAQLAGGGLLIGTGIAAMHYSGMAAMRLDGLIRYDARLFVLSIVVAVALATLALWIRFRLQAWQTRWNAGATIASAVVLGLAVSGMHYTAMAATYFIRDGDSAVVSSGITPAFLAAVVLVATSLIVVVTIVATYVGNRNLLSFRRSYRLIGTLVVGWGVVAWLSADYYHRQRADELYQQESQLASQQADQIASNMDEEIQRLKGVSVMVSRDQGTQRAFAALRRRFVTLQAGSWGAQATLDAGQDARRVERLPAYRSDSSQGRRYLLSSMLPGIAWPPATPTSPAASSARTTPTANIFARLAQGSVVISTQWDG